MTTLIVDGNCLLTIGYYGVKNMFYKGKHIGAIYHFLNTLRRLFEIYNIDKIVVFWDGEESSSQRRKIYSEYKIGIKKQKTEEEQNNFDYQKHRIQLYLEEVYVRQGGYQNCEADDCIAYYVQNTPNEKKIIFSSDRDLIQLLNETTSLYHPMHHRVYNPGDIIEFDHENIVVENVKLVKMICGDPSDNILGIRNLGIKRFLTLFPELRTQPMTLNEIRERGDQIFKEDKNNKPIQHFLSGVTKLGVYGDEFFDVNSKIIDLSEPFLTEDAKSQIRGLINENLDTEGRSYKHALKLMIEDGLFTALPKQDDAWIKFLNPFLRLTRKEKNKFLYKPNTAKL
jgi:DNA polymerase-1